MEVEEIKKIIVERAKVKKERDSLLADMPDMNNLTGGNPMAMMGMVSKLPDFKRAYELTRHIEDVSDQLVAELVRSVSNV